MPMRLMVNGREVTNPAVRMLAAMVMMSVIALVLALLVFVALPLAGIALGAAVFLLAVGAGSLLLGLPIALRRGLIGRRRERAHDDRDPHPAAARFGARLQPGGAARDPVQLG